MIIFGTRGITTTPATGSFYCPSCGREHDYRRRRVRRFFTLYFLPVIPLNKVGEYIECNDCRNTFREEVLDHQPSMGSTVDIDAEFHSAIKRVMAMMTVADGDVDEAEIETMRTIFGKLAGREVARHVIEDEVARARTGGRSVTRYLRDVAPMLNDEGKEMIIKAAYMVAAADGVFQQEEKQIMVDAANALQMTPAHLNGVISEMAGGD